jgi:hypothetical protein
MQVRIELIVDRDLRPIREALQFDGWDTAAERRGVLHATHADARRASQIRARLSRLGLLTSPSVRIEFLPTRR